LKISKISLVLAFPFAAALLPAQQTSDTFRWIDFHNRSDQNIVNWVTRSLEIEKWTAIREIGVIYDSALVVTADRSGAQSAPGDDAFTIWNVSLASHVVAPLVTGHSLRWFDWQHFVPNSLEELTILYDNCRNCAANTYFTALYYDVSHHMWAARWMRGGQGVPVWAAAGPKASSGTTWTQLYALMSDPDGRAFIATWSHFDYGKQRQPSDTVFRFDVDSLTGLERTVDLSGADGNAMKLRLCRGQDTVEGFERGQDSPLCQQLLSAQPQRAPVTTPPANNRGRSVPPPVHH